MEFITEQDRCLHEDCSTLILPALSIGNVGQLAVDLLVSTTRAERVGYLDDPYVLPCVGNDAYAPSPLGDLALPLEVYDSPANAISLVQQRSPVAKGMMIEFAKHLADFAAACGKRHVIILSSLDFGRWQQIDMSSLQMFYLSSTNADGTDDFCEQLGWKRLQEYDPAQRSWRLLSTLAEGKDTQDNSFPFEDDELEEEDYYPSLPFAALFSCCKAKGLKVTCVLCYCSEGDNTSDAFHLAGAASKLFERSPYKFIGDNGGKWFIPFSWRTVYGPPPDLSIF